MDRRSFIVTGAKLLGGLGFAALPFPLKAEEVITAASVPDALPPLEFSDELTELLAFLRPHTKMVCLGDTDHRRAPAPTYAFDRTNAKKLKQAGYDFVFTESMTGAQACYDIAADGNRAAEDVLNHCETKLYPDELLSKRDVRILSLRLVEAVRESETLKFIPIDQRFTAEGLKLMLDQRDYKGGVVDPMTAKYTIQIIEKNIKAGQDFAGICVYGAAHFDGLLNKECLYTQFKANGLKPITVNVYASRAMFDLNILSQTLPEIREPDIHFKIFEKPGQRVVFSDRVLEKEFVVWKEAGAPQRMQISRSQTAATPRPTISGLPRP